MDLSPNIRFWLNRIIKDLEKNWQTTTKKWPDAWFPWKGSIEQGDGIIIVGDKEVVVRYSLWQKRASIRDDLHSWGGAVWPVPFTELRNIKKIRLANGAEGSISPTRSSNDLVVFLGSGRYPTSTGELLHP